MARLADDQLQQLGQRRDHDLDQLDQRGQQRPECRGDQREHRLPDRCKVDQQIGDRIYNAAQQLGIHTGHRLIAHLHQLGQRGENPSHDLAGELRKVLT